MSKDLSAALKAHDREIMRWLHASEHWTRQEQARVLISWMGTANAKRMNDFLQSREDDTGEVS